MVLETYFRIQNSMSLLTIFLVLTQTVIQVTQQLLLLPRDLEGQRWSSFWTHRGQPIPYAYWCSSSSSACWIFTCLAAACGLQETKSISCWCQNRITWEGIPRCSPLLSQGTVFTWKYRIVSSVAENCYCSIQSKWAMIFYDNREPVPPWFFFIYALCSETSVQE